MTKVKKLRSSANLQIFLTFWEEGQKIASREGKTESFPEQECLVI